MRRKLWLLNLALLALVVLAGYRLREQWRVARAREQALLGQKVVVSAQKIGVGNAPQPVSAANYLDVAQKMLFSRDRNPNVEVDAPPPPKPMPPLPKAHGVMMLADPPTAILSEKSGGPQKSYRPGDKIGQFKVIEVTTAEIEFEWEGKRVRRTIEDLADKQVAQAVAAPEAAPAAPPPQQAGATLIGKQAETTMGPNNSSEPRPCDPNDSAPEGTVQSGMRKVYTNSPFGKICRWDPVK